MSVIIAPIADEGVDAAVIIDQSVEKTLLLLRAPDA
jgi:hypothetical protein